MTATLIIDGQNFMHRARCGMNLGEYSVVFNFFRNLRCIVEQFQKSDDISRVIFVLEGHPKFRYNLLETYKANRKSEVGSDKNNAMIDFHRQTKMVIELLQYFPVSVMRHPDFECDDVIFNIIDNAARSTNFIVASNDSDFVQLLQKFDNVKLYNPMTKQVVEAPQYDYVSWKALRGDGSDNIPGIPGIGDKRAQALIENIDKLEELFRSYPDKACVFNRNHKLIEFAKFNDEELMQVTSSNPEHNWQHVSLLFDEWKFNSILKTFWTKFTPTFDKLWITE
jgi:DNA polymerase-1